jgi:Trypsin-like peptidase domain
VCFPIAEYCVVGGRLDPPIRDDTVADAIGYLVCGVRVTQTNGVTTEIPIAMGTGFCVSTNGWILTNAHVVQPVWNFWDSAKNGFAQETVPRQGGTSLSVERVIWVFLGKSRKHEAKIAHYQLDESSGVDVCLLKIERTDCRSLPLTSEPRPKRGTDVLSYGFPDYAAEDLTTEDRIRKFRLEEKLKKLKASKVEDYFKDADFDVTVTPGSVTKIVDPASSQGRPWIMHSANLSHGNSGGPLITRDGTVLGINTRYSKGGARGEVGPASGFLAQSIPQFREFIEKIVPGSRWVP